MATTVHLKEDLLKRVDERAAQLGLSRNRYIVHALEKALSEETEWSENFLQMLREAASDTESHETVDEMLRIIESSRRSRPGPPEL